MIGARAGGVPDVVDDGQDGYLVCFGDTEQIAARIEELLADPALARTMGRRGRAKVLNTMTFEQKYRRLLEVYEKAVRRTQ